MLFRYLIRREAAQTKGLKTSKQLADLQEKRNALLCLIHNWREVQLIYTPHVASLIPHAQLPESSSPTASSSPPPETLPEIIPLLLPSSLPPHIRALPELKEICKLEQRLREPQADDALSEVRRQRRVIQGLWQFKQINISGTGNKPNTKMITLYKRFDNKTQRAIEKYRSAWRALCTLDPNGSWTMRLKELKNEHVSGPGREPDDASNSRYEPSWIWLMPRGGGPIKNETTIGEAEFIETMRVEWSKARARMRRWKEELLIVQEEMRRAIVYHRWKAVWWCERSSLRNHTDKTILSGVSGYAHKQATICSRMAERCAVYWLPHLKAKGIDPMWASNYEHLPHQVPDPLDAVEVEEEQEDMLLDSSMEGGEDEVEYVGNEEEIEAENKLDDDDCFDLSD